MMGESPRATMLIVALLSAVFSKDIVCLAIAPVLISACEKRRLDPVPSLLALACAANIGSAWTLIGNPQNILIGQTLRLSFHGYFLEAVVPVALGLAATWGLIVWQTRGQWHRQAEIAAITAEETRNDAPFNPWQTAKGLVVAAVLLVAFVFAPWPREHVALTAAGVLLMSRKLHSNKMLGLVDWELLVLFIGLFVVNHALQKTGLPANAVAELAVLGAPLDRPAPLFCATFLLSNIVANVPAA